MNNTANEINNANQNQPENDNAMNGLALITNALRNISQEQTTVRASNENISAITDMGFDENVARNALEHSGNNVQRAVDMLLNGFRV